MSHASSSPWHIPGWEVLGRIARGSTADILLARPDLTGEVTPASLSLGLSAIDQRVVLKRLYPHLAANEEFVRMFVDEVRLMSLLRSDDIVDVLDLDEDDETFYAVVELVDGPSLSAALRLHQKQRGGSEALGIDVGVACAIGHHVARALDVVHNARGHDGVPMELTHRDVNPQNILIGRDNVVKLADFGVALSASGRKSGHLASQGTDAGVLKGKASHLAPEQVLGRSVDGRADLFSLGVTLYQAVTGLLPFVGDSDVALLDAIIHATPPPLPMSQGHSSVIERLATLIMALLEKDPASRPQTAREVQAELASLLGHEDGVGIFVRSLGLPSLRG